MLSEWLLALITAAVASMVVIKAISRRPVPQSVRRIHFLSAVVAVLIMVSAALHRFLGTDRLLWGSDEMVTLMAGIRLHLLPLWNFGADVRENFFKSLVMPIHGLGDPVFFYVVVGLFRIMHLPVTEANLFTAGAVLAMVTLVLLFLFIHRLFGVGVALGVLALAAWNPSFIDGAKTGFQVNAILFLQVAILYGYYRHVVKNRWRSSLMMTGLMLLCAGTELFYLPPVLVLLHAVCQQVAKRHPMEGPSHTVAFWDLKNIVVWSGYGAMLFINLAILTRVGIKKTDLTLFGHFLHKLGEGASWIPHYNLQTFGFYLKNVLDQIPWAPLVLLLALVGVSLVYRRNEYAVFFAAYCAFVLVLTYAMKFSLGQNFMHVLVPAFVILALAAHKVVVQWLRWASRNDQTVNELAGVLCVALLLPLARPWIVSPRRQPPEAFRCLKAVGYAVRELGHPQMRVLLLSENIFAVMTMEYYTGLSATASSTEPTQLFFLKEGREAMTPRQLATHLGIERFDFYVDFVNETFPGKAADLAELQASGMHEVCRLETHGKMVARVFSPKEAPLRTISVEEGDRGFDRRYAFWDRLFYNKTVGTVWYFGFYY